MPVPVFHPKVKKIIAQCERRVAKLTNNSSIRIVILNQSDKILPYEEIENIVCDVTGIPISKAIKDSRRHELVITRHLICFFAKPYCRMGYQSIADRLQRTDHTTVISSIRRIMRLVESGDKEVCEYVNDINQRIEQLKAAMI